MIPLFYIISSSSNLNFNPHSSIQISQNCYPTPAGEGYCNITCEYNVSKDAFGRVAVTHTVWASIFEQKFNVAEGRTAYLQIQLPRRSYNYNIRSIFWNDIDNYGATGVNVLC